jgi:hypothetical protein
VSAVRALPSAPRTLTSDPRARPLVLRAGFSSEQIKRQMVRSGIPIGDPTNDRTESRNATTRPRTHFALRAFEPDPGAVFLVLRARNVLSSFQVGYH